MLWMLSASCRSRSTTSCWRWGQVCLKTQQSVQCILHMPKSSLTSGPLGFKRFVSWSLVLVRRLYEDGSPALSACWEDESINSELKAVAGASHAAVWHQRVLSSFAFTESRKRRRAATDDRLRQKSRQKHTLYIIYTYSYVCVSIRVCMYTTHLSNSRGESPGIKPGRAPRNKAPQPGREPSNKGINRWVW